MGLGWLGWAGWAEPGWAGLGWAGLGWGEGLTGLDHFASHLHCFGMRLVASKRSTKRTMGLVDMLFL